MASSNLQTQCPHCQTRFRVTEEQFEVAKGRVRCGSCMQIFNALENRIEELKPVVTTPPEPVINPDPDDDLVFADNPEEDAAHGAYIKADMTFAEDELSDSFRSMSHSVYTDDRDSSSDINPDSDESWAHAILDEANRHDDPRRPAPPVKAAPSVKATSSKNEPPLMLQILERKTWRKPMTAGRCRPSIRFTPRAAPGRSRRPTVIFARNPFPFSAVTAEKSVHWPGS